MTRIKNGWSLPKIMVGHGPIFDSGQKESLGTPRIIGVLFGWFA